MAKFDISPVNGGAGSCVSRSSVLTRLEDRLEANYEPASPTRMDAEVTRMCARYVGLKRVHWGICPQVARRVPVLVIVLILRSAAADPLAPLAPTVPDPPATPQRISVPPATFTPSWDLDGVYLWLGPIGAASYTSARWDSTFGGDASLVVVRERAMLGLVGANLGASRWTVRGGGRVWVDGLVGTRLLGHMMGASLGPIFELSELAHTRLGASIGVWGFAGITPFVRLGTVADLGIFAELGVHIALPVLRR
jgi:hypothetical protein